jgi:hypothetical protein
MKKDIAKKWVKALRSGQYKQGKSFLKQFNSKGQPRYCCLGVLCELYNDTMTKNHKKTISVKAYNNEPTLDHGYVKFANKDGSLPAVVRKWAGIKNEMGTFDYFEKDAYGTFKRTHTKCLADLNDTGTKFSTIADIIEKNVENL